MEKNTPYQFSKRITNHKQRQSLLSFIPFVHLLFSFASNYVFFDIPIVGNLVGYSLLTDIFYLIVMFNKRFCIYSKMAVVALFFLNIFGLLGNIINYYEYSTLYDGVLITTLAGAIVIKFIKDNALTKHDAVSDS